MCSTGISSEGRFLLLWLCAAALVTVLRWLSAAELNWDLAVQIQAAQNLLAGKGLSYYGSGGPDLAEPAQLFTLTHWPSGYSLCAAALITLGVSVGGVIKVLGTAGTMLGWGGWGELAFLFFREGLHGNPLWQGAGFAIAIVSPLLFTVTWPGTDIFLWAAVPWVVAWVVRAADEHVPGGRWLDGLAGAVCGLCVLLRYASLFLVVYAAGLMLWQSRLRLLVLTRRWVFFGLGLLPALALQVYINHFLANASAAPGGLRVSPGLRFVVRRAWDGLPLLSTATYPWVFWLPRVEDLFSQVAEPLPWRLGLTVGLTCAVLVVLVLVVRTYGLRLAVVVQDPRTAYVGLFIVLPLVLWGCLMFGTYDYLADPRYYWPIVPLSVFVVYSFAFRANVTKRSGLSRLLHLFGVVYLTGYLAVSLACIGLFFVPAERSSSPRAMLMGKIDLPPYYQRVPWVPWPSMAMNYEFSPARQFVMERLKEQSNTLLLTSRDLWKWFMVDPAVDQARLYSLTCARYRLKAQYLSGPARLVILSFDNGEPQELWNYLSHATSGRRERADCFERLPSRHLLQRFPEEGLMVLETHVPAGMRVILGPVTR